MDLMVCVGSSCHLKHSREIIECFTKLIKEYGLEAELELKGSFCMNHCSEKGVAVKIADNYYSVELSDINDFFVNNVVEVLQNGTDKCKEGQL
jgi:NADH:ubiquinone oxidoreductase subunit E